LDGRQVWRQEEFRRKGELAMRLWKEWTEFLKNEDGIGVIEIVLILVVLIGLVLIFKKQITSLLESIFKEINKQSKEVY